VVITCVWVRQVILILFVSWAFVNSWLIPLRNITVMSSVMVDRKVICRLCAFFLLLHAYSVTKLAVSSIIVDVSVNNTLVWSDIDFVTLFTNQWIVTNFSRKNGNSLDKLRHPRSDAYSAQQVLLNKQQLWCGGAYLDCYPFTENIFNVAHWQPACLTGRFNHHIRLHRGTYRTTSEFHILPHPTTNVTKTVRKDQLFYSQYIVAIVHS